MAECDVQRSLFAPADAEKYTRLMQVVDSVNHYYGRGKLKTAAEGTGPFHMNRNHTSRRYTTEWDDLLVVKAK